MRRRLSKFEVLAIIILIAVLASALIPAIQRTNHGEWDRRCEANLISVWNALRAYVAEYGDGRYLPPKIELLPSLGLLPDRDLLMCPAKKRSYNYFSGLTIDLLPEYIVLWEEPPGYEYHTNMLLLDGSITYYGTREHLNQLLSKQRSQLGTLPIKSETLPPARPTD